MGIEVNQYRESIGKYYTRARSVKKGKLLSITDIACFNLLLLYGTKITPLLILVHFFCKAAETRDVRIKRTWINFNSRYN
jgi:hypothetical protein